MPRLPLLLVLLAGCAADGATERYAFVARLGRDTVSVERVARSPRKLVTDGVDRFPIVRQRHTEIDLEADGRLRRMVMDVRTPSGATPAERERRVTADFSGNDVHISIRDSAGVRDTSFTTGGVLTVPHVSMMYSVIELEIASALRQRAAAGGEGGMDTRIPFRQFYPDRTIGRSFALHRGAVRPRPDGIVELQHDWLSGVGIAVVDSAGRMQSYDGSRSTYKVAVERTSELPDVESIGARFAATERERGAAPLSVRDTTRGRIGRAELTIDYGRPLARGRVLLGDVIPYDRIWRTGANAATQLTTSVPITLAGVSLPAGTYTLWTVPHADRIELIVNAQTGQWGTQYRRDKDVGRGVLGAQEASEPVEQFTISVEAAGERRGALVLEWGTFRWTVPIVVR